MRNRRFPSFAATFAVSSVLLLAACSRQEATPDAATTPAAQPSATTQPEAQPAPVEAPAVPAVPVLRALDPAQRAEVLVAAVDCNLESADGQAFAGADVTLSTPSRTSVSGWLKSAAAPMTDTVLRVETPDKAQIWDVPVREMTPREDLATAAETAASGFKLEFDASSLPSGRYHLYLAYRAGGVLYGCDNGRHINVL